MEKENNKTESAILIMKKKIINNKAVEVRFVKILSDKILSDENKEEITTAKMLSDENKEGKEKNIKFEVYARLASEEEITTALNLIKHSIEDLNRIRLSPKYKKQRYQIASLPVGNLAFNKRTEDFYKIINEKYE